MSKLFTATTLLLCLSLNASAQADARASGEFIGRMLFYVLLVVGLIFLLRRAFKKKK